MAEYKFNLDDIANVRKSEDLKPDFSGSNLGKGYEEERYDKTSLFGTPVRSNLEIPAGEYTDLDGNKINFQGIRIDAVIFDVSQERNIVRTPISGKNGTIKQFISDGDYLINVQAQITGLSVANGKKFDMKRVNGVPEQELRKLHAILKVPREIEIVSEFLDFFGISTVVVASYNVGQKEGFRGEVDFNASFISDEPIELK